MMKIYAIHLIILLLSIPSFAADKEMITVKRYEDAKKTVAQVVLSQSNGCERIINFDENGFRTSDSYWHEGKKCGPFIRYYPKTSHIMELFTYDNDVRQGESKGWYPSGQLSAVSFYFNDLPLFIAGSIEFYENGKIKSYVRYDRFSNIFISVLLSSNGDFSSRMELKDEDVYSVLERLYKKKGLTVDVIKSQINNLSKFDNIVFVLNGIDITKLICNEK